MLEQIGNKIKCLEGIRGIAAFIVVLHHFGLAFYPTYYSMNLAEGHMDNGNVEKMVGTSPLNFFLNGSMAVSVFFVLSGIVLSFRYFQTKNGDILRGLAIKRYPRLMLPVLFTTLLFYGLKYSGLVFSSQAAVITKSVWWLPTIGGFELDAWLMLKKTLWSVFFTGDNSYITVLWTMSMEIYGSFLVFAVLLLFGQMRSRSIIYGAICLYFLIMSQPFHLAFIIGIILSDLLTNKPQIFTQLNKPFILIPLLIIGFYLGSYPTSNFVKIE
jgi:peptidoglycan/LPS O-acetylase OafA/YrhL